MKKSPGARSLKLFSLAAKIGSSEIAQSLKEKFLSPSAELATQKLNARLDQAKMIAENLSQMKGAAMKAGQLLSIDAGDYFPPEAMEVLAKLQASANPISFDEIHRVLIEEIGEKRFGDLEDFEIAPIAAASIGQVHRAKLFGRDVAVKVQYPGVAESIESDLKILRKVAKSFIGVSGREMDLQPLFAEFQRVLEQEADYRIELALTREYRNLVGESKLYRIPEPIESHSARRVLTMTWAEGTTIDTWLRSRPPIERREKIAHSLLDLFCQEFFDWGLVQTDPNFANFLIAPDDALVILDFGATLRYDEDFRRRYRNFLGSIATLNPAEIIREGEAFELISPLETQETKNLFAELLINSVEPFFASNQPFEFTDADYARRNRELGEKFARALKHSPPPQKILFLHRKLGGIFNFVKKLGVNMDLTPYWQRMVGRELPRV